MRQPFTLLACSLLLNTACHHIPPQPPTPPLPTPQTWNVACVVTDLDTHRPIQNAICHDGPFSALTNADGYYLFVGVPAGQREMFANAPGYTEVGQIYQNDHNQDVPIALRASWPQPQILPPLTFEGDSGSYICHHDQIVAIPYWPDINFWRGDAWGVTIPGLPFVQGGSSRHPERVLTWFFDRYPPEWQKEILNAYRHRGYTHFPLSWPDSRDGNGQSIAQFVATANQVKSAIPYVAVFLTSKDFDPRDAEAVVRLAGVSPVVDALRASRAVDILVVGWELDTFNTGQRLEDFIHLLHGRYPDMPLWVHFTTYKTAWQPDGQPRDQFWRATRGELTGLLYQGNQNDSCGLQQAHYNDAMVPASGLSAVGARLVPFELVAANEFDGDHPNEDDANARGWCVMNTPGPLLSSGFGNGARYPDGRPTLSQYPR